MVRRSAADLRKPALIEMTEVQKGEGSESPERTLPTGPGWFPDPYDPEAQRWFDGSSWTMHAVAGWDTDPDRAVVQNWSMYSSEQLRRQEWEEQFPPWDGVVARTCESRLNRGMGFAANRRGYLDRRYPWWEAIRGAYTPLCTATATGLLAVKAGTANEHQSVWAILSAAALVLTVSVAVPTVRKLPRRRRMDGHER